MDKQIYQTKHDNNLRQISSLNWLPWIGENYDNQKIKLMIIGESHYANGEQEQKYNNKQYTRIIHKETAVLRNYYNIKVYANFHRAMFGNDTFDNKKKAIFPSQKNSFFLIYTKSSNFANFKRSCFSPAFLKFIVAFVLG